MFTAGGAEVEVDAAAEEDTEIVQDKLTDEGRDKIQVPTKCQRSSNPFYVANYYIKLVTTSWAHSNSQRKKQQS